MSTQIKAVIFDIGGVVLRSPFIGIAAYEKKNGLPPDYLNCSITGRGAQGAWQRFERGELPLTEFYGAFSHDLSDTENGNKWYKAYCARKGIRCPRLPERLNINGRELFGTMMREAQSYNPYVREAILRIRETRKWKVIALTNNFQKVDIPQEEREFLGWSEGTTPDHLLELFDDFCDSSTLGMRKPEPEFYLTACARNNLEPHEVVFLDDIGMNLKAAKRLGMDTIHVPIGGALDAVKKLGAKLGIDLVDPEAGNERPKL
ncbi:HAD-like protein [Macrolepiota fuliginosa MF-IS2]|uniref:HAD-like protein n=1 Tax=Macrolepiota fuliginosa MF-IS2 TaxID=1400762 RepID=A0A9P5XMN0_9AGAR|nr:HAD-like protein [Macrolepiota fuliginosa MF-IS2]